jgi:hypothetical protein
VSMADQDHGCIPMSSIGWTFLALFLSGSQSAP